MWLVHPASHCTEWRVSKEAVHVASKAFVPVLSGDASCGRNQGLFVASSSSGPARNVYSQCKY